ncbi:hypothetical protein CH330_05685 [candidate division WOR-3 bacterium JGI_Cruoil_03_51_56]|uniref:Uncharacterized protein n=1 Tax=candidate division WOR-3 bacterium JGI_Cruoil_03_51_56 TaxID=1973747 RepID=A0A235BT81_UNCW3|nr:MAG: hypothetical protein CH330_05685 [candidate division WOR-3 bacterium JGI_Cruoil_03_51_56]
MDYESCEMLKAIRSRHPSEFGKACQVLLAITCCRLGFRNVVERRSQGVDIDARSHPAFADYSFEVKTTHSSSVSIGTKDVEGLEAKAKDSFRTAYAVLRPGLLSDWIIAGSKGIPAGNIPLGRFEARELPDIQCQVRRVFPHVLKEHAAEILRIARNEVQGYLQKCLADEKRKCRQR